MLEFLWLWFLYSCSQLRDCDGRGSNCDELNCVDEKTSRGKQLAVNNRQRPSQSLCLSVFLSVCLSVTFRYRDHIGWNISKIISRPNSLRPMRLVAPTWVIWCNGNTPKIRVECGWSQEHIKAAAKSPKRCKIGPRLLLQTNRKSHTGF